MPNCSVIEGSAFDSNTETVVGCGIDDIEAGKHLDFSLRIKIKEWFLKVDPEFLFIEVSNLNKYILHIKHSLVYS